MTRLYARAMKSSRVNDYTPDVRFEKTSVISSIRLSGEQAPFMFKGSLNGEMFSAYVREILAPTLKTGDIVILDNLSAHKVKGALDPIYKIGATVLFLPPYSPDYNPIELCWAKMKALLRKLKPRCIEALLMAMKSALDYITDSDIVGWFRHCGYRIHV